MSTKKEKEDAATIDEESEEESDCESLFEISEEEYEVITLEYTIPGTNNFVRLNLLDADEERTAFADMYETCGADFKDYEVL